MATNWTPIYLPPAEANSNLRGPRGPIGPSGSGGTGSSLPPGGSINQILFKLSGANGDAGWRSLISGDLPSHDHAASQITTGTIATARLGAGTASSSTFLRGDQTWVSVVTSVGIVDATGIFNVTGSPVTSAGSITVNFLSQAARKFLIGPTTGSAAPTFRLMDTGDLPNAIPASKLGSNAPTSNTYLKGTNAWTQVAHSELSGLTSGDPHTQYITRFPSMMVRNTVYAGSDKTGLAIVVESLEPFTGSDPVFFVGKPDDNYALWVTLGADPSYAIVGVDGTLQLLNSPVAFTQYYSGGEEIRILPPTAWTDSYDIILPPDPPANNTYLRHVSGGQLAWSTVAGGGGGGGGNNYFPGGWV